MRAYKKKGKATFINIPYAIMDHPNFRQLSPYGIKLICDLLREYNDYNNGDLCATWKLMKEKGWRSPTSLHRTIQELLHYELLQLTQQGGKHRPSLYAFSWHNIDECKGKLDVSPTKEASGLWKNEKERFDPKSKRKIKKRSPYVYQSTPHVYQLHENQGVKP